MLDLGGGDAAGTGAERNRRAETGAQGAEWGRRREGRRGRGGSLWRRRIGNIQGVDGMARGYESTRWVLRVEEPTTDRLERKFDDDEGGRPTKLTNGGGGALSALIG